MFAIWLHSCVLFGTVTSQQEGSRVYLLVAAGIGCDFAFIMSDAGVCRAGIEVHYI